MVEQVITYITANWVAWLFAGAYAILIALYKKRNSSIRKKEKKTRQCVRDCRHFCGSKS